jgi:hypothetical protein
MNNSIKRIDGSNVRKLATETFRVKFHICKKVPFLFREGAVSETEK